MPGTNPLEHIRVKMARADLGRVLNASGGSVEIVGVLFVYCFLCHGLDQFVKFVVNASAWGPFWPPMPRPCLLLQRPPGEGGVGFT